MHITTMISYLLIKYIPWEGKILDKISARTRTLISPYVVSHLNGQTGKATQTFQSFFPKRESLCAFVNLTTVVLYFMLHYII